MTAQQTPDETAELTLADAEELCGDAAPENTEAEANGTSATDLDDPSSEEASVGGSEQAEPDDAASEDSEAVASATEELCNDAAPENAEAEANGTTAADLDDPSSEDASVGGSEQAEPDYAASEDSEAAASATEELRSDTAPENTEAEANGASAADLDDPSSEEASVGGSEQAEPDDVASEDSEAAASATEELRSDTAPENTEAEANGTTAADLDDPSSEEASVGGSEQAEPDDAASEDSEAAASATEELRSDTAPENTEAEANGTSAADLDDPSSDHASVGGSEQAEPDDAASEDSEAAASAIENADAPDVPPGGIPADEACSVIETSATPAGTDIAAVAGGALSGESGGAGRITRAELSDLAIRHGEASDPAARLPLMENEVPPKALAKLYPAAQAALRILCRRPPIVAGQNPSLFFDLLEMAVEEWRPQTVLECSLVKQIVDAAWELLTFQEVQSWLVSAAIASDLFSQMAELGVEGDDGEMAKRILAHGEPGVELLIVSGVWREIRRVVFAAVGGDPGAVAFVERKIGAGKVAIGPETAKHFERSIPTHLFADRVIAARIARRDAADRHLQKIRMERLQRKAAHQRTVSDIRAELSVSEYAALLADPLVRSKRDAETASVAPVHAPVSDQNKSGGVRWRSRT
jgi:hypothetical protein